MDDLLTTRQLQDLLHVDRITIYRMLGDGRLSGFKVGGQWRFSRRQIESWLRQQATLSPTEASAADNDRLAQPLPVGCVQAIQAIYAEALDVAAVTVGPDGESLTAVSNSCAFCDLVLSTEAGRRACALAWRAAAANGTHRAARPHACHAGLNVVAAPVYVAGEWVATVAGCQFTEAGEGRAGAGPVDLPGLAARLGLVEGELRAAATSIRRVPPANVARIAALIDRVAETLAKIGHERRELVGRLRRIAEMTNV